MFIEIELEPRRKKKKSKKRNRAKHVITVPTSVPRKKKYSTDDAIQMVIKDGLRPMEALRATGFPCSQSSFSERLSRLKSLAVQDALPLAAERSVASSSSPSPSDSIGNRLGGQSIHRPPNDYKSASVSKEALAPATSVPLKTSWWEDEVEKLRVAKAAEASGKAEMLRVTSEANELCHATDYYEEARRASYSAALKEATTRYSASCLAREEGTRGESVRAIVADVNAKYGLNEPIKNPRDSSIVHLRESLRVSETTVRRYVREGCVGSLPLKKGPKVNLPAILVQDREKNKETMVGTRKAAAFAAFATYTAGEKMFVADWKAILHYVVPLDGQEDATKPSVYTTLPAMKARLERTTKTWQEYFHATAFHTASATSGSLADGKTV